MADSAVAVANLGHSFIAVRLRIIRVRSSKMIVSIAAYMLSYKDALISSSAKPHGLSA